MSKWAAQSRHKDVALIWPSLAVNCIPPLPPAFNASSFNCNQRLPICQPFWDLFSRLSHLAALSSIQYTHNGAMLLDSCNTLLIPVKLHLSSLMCWRLLPYIKRSCIYRFFFFYFPYDNNEEDVHLNCFVIWGLENDAWPRLFNFKIYLKKCWRRNAVNLPIMSWILKYILLSISTAIFLVT